MRNILIGLFIGLGINLLANELTTEQKLKAELFKIKLQASQCQLVLEQSNLLRDFRATLGASEQQEFDWQTLKFKE